MDELRLDVLVGNYEEEAHETMLFITLPSSLSYIGTDERVRRPLADPELQKRGGQIFAESSFCFCKS